MISIAMQTIADQSTVDDRRLLPPRDNDNESRGSFTTIQATPEITRR